MMNKKQKYLPKLFRKVSFFMKKIILLSAIFILLLICYYNKSSEIVIPKDSVRFRIIPNSNSQEDLHMKELLKVKLYEEKILNENNINISDARKNLKSKVPKVKKIIKKEFVKNNYTKSFDVNYGYNYFPEKKYKGVKYQSGEYESLVIKIGEAKGDNFWCVLYPPLCMLEDQNIETKDYKFLITDILKRYL